MRALAAALVCLALPAAANAADYGGGTAPDSVRRANDQLTLVGFRMADDGTGRATITVATDCGALRATARDRARGRRHLLGGRRPRHSAA